MAGWLNRKPWCLLNNCKSDRSTISHQAIQPSGDLKVIDLFGQPPFLSAKPFDPSFPK
jgi:hypothetical protein